MIEIDYNTCQKSLSIFSVIDNRRAKKVNTNLFGRLTSETANKAIAFTKPNLK